MVLKLITNRKQCVDISGSSKDIKISILQGSVLGPVLFLCYINVLHTVTDLLVLILLMTPSVENLVRT
jgi:hypothetical protein